MKRMKNLAYLRISLDIRGFQVTLDQLRNERFTENLLFLFYKPSGRNDGTRYDDEESADRSHKTTFIQRPRGFFVRKTRYCIDVLERDISTNFYLFYVYCSYRLRAHR